MKTNYKFGEVFSLSGQIENDKDKVQVRNIFETSNGGVTLLAFKEGQKLDTHLAPFEVMVTVLEGEIEFTMLDKVHVIKANEFFLMGADTPHSVKATADAKIMLIKLKN